MRRAAAIAGVVVALLLVGAASIPFLASGDFLKARIAGQIAAWTGRTVTITGNPSLSFYPYLAVTVDGLVIGNAGDGTNPEDALVAADVLRATLRPLPLLIGRAEFEEFELIRPRIRLVMGKDGGGNWRMAGSAIVAQAEEAASAAEEAPRTLNAVTTPTAVLQRPNDVQIGRLRISDGIVLFDDLATERREELSDVDVEIAWPSAAAPAGGSGHVTWRGLPVEFNGSVAHPLALIGGGASAVRFAVASTVARIGFTGSATLETGSLTLEGPATISTPSLRATLAWLGPDIGTGPILGAAAVRGNAHWSGDTITINDATVELDGNTATGSVALAVGGQRPRLTAQVSAPHIDLTPYVEATRADFAAREPWILAAAHVPFADTLNADITLAAGQIIAGNLRLGDVSAKAGLADGAFSVALEKAQLYGGSVAGSLSTSSSDGGLSAALDLVVKAVPAGITLRELAGASGIDGRSDLSLNAAAFGKTWGEFVRAARGGGRVKVVEGVLTGFDLPSLADLMSDPLAEIGPTDTRTPFYDLSARFSIAEGNVVTDTLAMQGSGYRLNLAGQGSLVTGLVEATALLSTPTTEAPIAISGRWDDPSVVRDLERPRPGATLVPPPTGG